MRKDLGLFLARCCRAAPSADNSQPCHVDWHGSKLLLRYDAERVSDYTFPAQSQATLLSVGAAIENISQCCEMDEADLEVSYFPDGVTADVFAEVSFSGDNLLARADLKHPLFLRHTNRFAYKKTPIPRLLIDQVERFRVGNASIRVLEEKGLVASVASQVQAASEIRFQTREVHEWLGRSLRFTPEQVDSGDGLDVATLDLPPAGGVLLRFISDWARMRKLNRVGIYKMLAAIDAAPVKKAPAVLAITAPDTQAGALEAGQLLCRAWIYLNAQGIACHPYYVISDQLERLKQGSVPESLVVQAEGMRKNCRQLLDLNDGETLMMLLRIGYPVRNAPRSQRLPLEQVFTDLTES